MPRKSIPERWEIYHCVNSTVGNTRLVPFKTPLRESAFISRPYLEPWTPRDVLNTIPNLGLVINLCFARNPYYVTRDFENMGVNYVWIPCVGHEVPDEEVVGQFVDCVEDFLLDEGNYSRLIGVHCTHGVNRTGYIICRYLMDILKYKPDRAIHIFKNARGYPIERPTYVDALYQHWNSNLNH